MKKIVMILIAIIGFGLSAFAQDFCDKKGNRIEFYPKKTNGVVSFFDGGVIQISVVGNFINNGTYKVDKNITKNSYGSYYVIEFYDKGESTASLYGKYYKGLTSRDGEILEKARIEILGVTLETCEKKR
jgi:hypothetical protein